MSYLQEIEIDISKTYKNPFPSCPSDPDLTYTTLQTEDHRHRPFRPLVDSSLSLTDLQNITHTIVNCPTVNCQAANPCVKPHGDPSFWDLHHSFHCGPELFRTATSSVQVVTHSRCSASAPLQSNSSSKIVRQVQITGSNFIKPAYLAMLTLLDMYILPILPCHPS